MKIFIQIIAYTLMCVSALLAAKMPEQGSKYPVSFGIFLVTIGISIILLMIDRFLLVKTKVTTKTKRQKTLNLAFETTAFMSRLIVFRAQIKDIDEKGLCELVDTIYHIFINDLVDRKDEIFQNIGITEGAKFFTSLANVEMYLNRAYSMASDGYLEEAKTNLDSSIGRLEHLLKAV